MFCPLLNSTVKKCDNALSALDTVSLSFIADVRRVLEAMCNDPSIEDRPILQMSRADPGASDGIHTYRVYSPEINTNEKLRRAVARHLEGDDGVDVPLSSSTLQRMINDFLKIRSSRVKFLQSDHNACPTCKTLSTPFCSSVSTSSRLKPGNASRMGRALRAKPNERSWNLCRLR